MYICKSWIKEAYASPKEKKGSVVWVYLIRIAAVCIWHYSSFGGLKAKWTDTYWTNFLIRQCVQDGMCMVRLVTSHVHIGTHVCNINLNMHKDKEMCSADNLHNNLLNTTDKLQDKCTITKEMCENTIERTDFFPNSTNFINKMFTDKSLRHKFVHTGCVCLSMVALVIKQNLNSRIYKLNIWLCTV